MSWEGALALVATVVAAALVLATAVWRRRDSAVTAPAPAPAAAGAPVPSGPLVAFIANPSKPDVPALRATLLAACAGRYLPQPLWLETTVEDPGVGQARQAVEAGADLVVAVGGDGTVRAVAEALAGTATPMGLMPVGTGNLLARNLDLPLADPLAALAVVLDGRDQRIDVGWVRVEQWESDVEDPVAQADDDLPENTDVPRDHIFLVIAGLGFDAAMVADTDAGLKAKVGWIAYFVAGIRHLHGRRSRVQVRIDDHPVQSARVRSLLIGNCGRLPGGITLLPDAILDDGWLDVAAIDTQAGVAGWAQLLGEVVLQGAGVRTDMPKIGRIDHIRARNVRVQVAGGEYVQVDGDIVGRVSVLSARVDPLALAVRVPANPQS